ncbi:hypothetical protein [Cyanobacterium sp. Dongsha4]|uniref:NACHT C-terminal alpha/beta 1 domain-containing protein n=1 Tax=Cyanobacterium sp. DS4 TaxID=2878255 RepID=UPI002E820838|nr:hypothetical protein [Cyanobacterium sp. Dongsha4]WVK99142.1 hypothetical protein Dongsha4_10575 [Cyanobacterium sp. Dongsha4]
MILSEELLENQEEEKAKAVIANKILELDKNHQLATNILVEIVEKSEDIDLVTQLEEFLEANINAYLEKYVNIKQQKDQKNQDWIAYQCARYQLGDSSKFQEGITTLINLIKYSTEIDTRSYQMEFYWDYEGDYIEDETFVCIATLAAQTLQKTNIDNFYNVVISELKDYLSPQIKQSEKYRYDACHELLLGYAQTINYLEFYKAWHSQPNIHPEMQEIMPVGENNLTQTLQQQISVNSLKQLQPTEAVYPIIIDLFSLAGETDQSAITQEISYQIYQQVFPEDLDIPEINNAPQLKRIIGKIKQWVKKEKIALIFYNHEPYSELVNFCQKISNAVNIGWVTNESVPSFIRGFSPNQINLFSIIQNWLNDI